MFAMNGVAVWVSLLNPRRGNFTASFGNDLSVGGNITVLGSIFFLLFAPRGIAKLWPGIIGLQNWWVPAVLIPVALIFYFNSLRLAERTFVARREYLLGIMEGRA